MKRQYITLLLTLALAAASCKKAEPVILMYETEPLSADEVFFGIPKGSAFCSGQDGFADDGGETTEETAGTKAVTATSLPSFAAAATKGAPGSENACVWINATFTSDGAPSPTYTGTEKYWPHTDQGYNFYAVAATAVSAAASGPATAAEAPAMTFSTTGTTVTTDGTKDVVCAYIPWKDGTIGEPEPEKAIYKAKNGLTFEHVYSRLSTVTVNTTPLYRVYDIDIRIVNAKTGGTYNLRTGKNRTDGTGWSALTPAAPADTRIYRNAGSIAVSSSHTGGDNNLYVVPGEYYLKATWTATIDDPQTADPYIQTYTDITSSSTVSLVGGKVNALSVELMGNATEITFSVTILPWDYNDVEDVGFNHE